jgi:AcrR family transcriptional regulator
MTTELSTSPMRRRYAGEPPERRTARRKEQFIVAGRLLFGTIGYRKTTMRVLCKQAKLTDRYFYESFETIEDLLVAVYEQLIGEMQTAILQAVQSVGVGQSADVYTVTGLDAFFRYVEEPTASRVVWFEVLAVSPRVDALYNAALRRFADMLLTLIRAALPEWHISDDLGRVVSMGLIGAVSESAKDWLMTNYTVPRETMVHGMALLFSGLAHINERTVVSEASATLFNAVSKTKTG